MKRYRFTTATPIVALTVILSGCATHPQMKQSSPSVQPSGLVVQASLSTAGPYGEYWDLTIAPDRSAFLEVYYSRDPSGAVTGRFFLTAAAVAEIQAAVTTQRFQELPSEISEEWIVLHHPDYYITVTMNGQSHRVNLYNPGQLGGIPEAQRFLAVWDTLFRSLPLKPPRVQR